jgi:uncharacterized membrane protein YbaN (DUF454 family)
VESPPTERAVHRSLPLRGAYIAVGMIFVGIGAIGVIVPGLPTTVFLIAAAWCFSRSSPRLERWLLDLPVLGQFVRGYRAGLGMPRSAKRSAYASIVVAVAISTIFLLDRPWVRAGLVIVGLIGIAYISRVVPTRPQPSNP